MRFLSGKSRRPGLLRVVPALGAAAVLSLSCVARAQTYQQKAFFPVFPNNPNANASLLGIGSSGGTVYVSTYVRAGASGAAPVYNTVQMFTLAGQNIGSFGASGNGAGQFNQSAGGGANIATFGANVYVTDPGNSRIEVFDATGNFVSQFSTGSSLGVAQSSSLAVNSANIYVTDTANNRVDIFDKSGNLVSQFGSLGSGAGQFGRQTPGPADPTSLASTDSRVYVSDPVNNRVEIFDTSGGFVSQFTGPRFNGQTYFPRAIAANGVNLFIDQGNLISIFDLNGNYQSSFAAPELGDFAVNGTKVYTQFVLGNDVILFDVPEPGSAALLCGVGVWGASLLQRRRRRTQSDMRNF